VTLSFPHAPFLVAVVACSLGPALLFLLNQLFYRAPARTRYAGGPISVLIPARDEERSIAAAVEHALGTLGAEIEVIVLDDASSDRTAAIVEAIATRDARVRLASAPPLPPGWNGKQHACHVLASLATHSTLCFLDADVRLAPDALARLAAFMESRGAGLVSGFPREETGSPLEWMLIPLIHFVLLSYLPFAGMRWAPRWPGFAAGCGQVLMVRRSDYRAAGGHAAIRETMHDGLLLPQLFRRHGFATDLADLTSLARCRMYTDAGQVWRGLAKNATEGMAAPARIVPFSVLLLLGQVAPLPLFLLAPSAWATVALAASYVPRLIAAARFRQNLLGALLHPLGVAILLVLQWYALVQKLGGKRTTWKQRAYRLG
jgi:hypothetical protein